MNKLAGFFAAIGIVVATSGAASAADIVTYDFNGPVTPAGDVKGDFTLDLTTSKIGAFDFTTPFGVVIGSGGLFTKLAGGFDDLTFASLKGGKLNTLNLLFDPATDTFEDSAPITRRLNIYSTDTCVSLAKVCDGARAFTADFTKGADVTALPEPTTWAMMLVGFFGLGTILRRKQVGAGATA